MTARVNGYDAGPKLSKAQIKDLLDDDELDLSLQKLTSINIPLLKIVEQLTFKKLDLSANILTTLPSEFFTLTSLVRLDLSKNRLTSLPDSIGQMKSLEQLDLFANSLERLPLSFCFLGRLKWLDLKDNPLEPGLESTAGRCLDDLQCKKCARQVLEYYKNLFVMEEERNRKDAERARDLESKRQKEADKEAARLREVKRSEKEKRKRELAEAKSRQAAQKREEESSHTTAAVPPSDSRSHGWKVVSSIIIFVLLLVVGALCYQQRSHLRHYFDQVLISVEPMAQQVIASAKGGVEAAYNVSGPAIKEISRVSLPLYEKVKALVTSWFVLN